MVSIIDKNLLPAFESIKDDKEEILWTGKPKFIPFIFSGFSFMEALIIILFAFFFIFIGTNFIFKLPISPPSFFWLFGLFPLVLRLFTFLQKVFSFSNTVYAYSDKRVMMRSGFIGTNFKTIDYDKITDIEVTVSIIEKIYHVGTIKFFSGRTVTDKGSTTKLFDSWSAIENPYEVFKMVKQTSVNIKTDFNYPNALRPEINPGYNTKYDPKE